MNKPLSNFDFLNDVKYLGTKLFKDGVFSRNNLPNRISKECGIVNIDDKIEGPLYIFREGVNGHFCFA